MVDSAETQRQIDRLKSLPSLLVDEGEPIPWEALDNPAERRTLLQFILGDRRVRVDKHTFMADRPPIAVATVIDGAVVRLEFYEGHDALEKTFDLRAPALQGKTLPNWMDVDPMAYDPVAFLQSIGFPREVAEMGVAIAHPENPAVTRTTYRVQLLRHEAVVQDLGETVAPVPKVALSRLATSYVAAGWRYEDQVSGDGQLINPADPSERIEAVAVFPDSD